MYTIFWIIAGIVTLGAVAGALYSGYQYRALPADDPRAARMHTLLMVSGSVGVVFLILFFLFLILARRNTLVVPGLDITGPGNTRTPIGFSTSGIERHSPRRNATDVPRNTTITITFREAVDSASLIDDQGTETFEDDRVRADAMTLRTSTGANIPLLGRLVMPRAKTIIATPLSTDGALAATSVYDVELTSAIQKKSGGALLAAHATYSWSFTTGASVDVTPPTIQEIRPASRGSMAPNSIIQVQFSEPVLESTVTSLVGGRASLLVTVAGKDIPGVWALGADGATAEFTPAESCGKNACGTEIFCLPRAATLELVIHAASVGGSAPRAETPYNGIIDLQGNSLDGNGNGRAEGEADTVRYPLTTIATIDAQAPTIISVHPSNAETTVDPKAPIEVVFSRPIRTESVSPLTLSIEGYDGSLAYRFRDVSGRTHVTIDHEPFGVDHAYAPTVSGRIEDAFQNCYQPCTGP